MAPRERVKDVLALPPEDRLALVQEVWDGLLDEPGAAPLTDAQKQELDRRYEDYVAHPDEGHTWEEVEAFVKAGLRA